MTVSPCTCEPIPVRSSREFQPGAVLVDLADERGRWHAVKVGASVFRMSLVAPSAEEIARAEAIREAGRPAEEERRRADALAACFGQRDLLLAALALRASPEWASMPAELRQRVQAVIGTVADLVRELLA